MDISEFVNVDNISREDADEFIRLTTLQKSEHVHFERSLEAFKRYQSSENKELMTRFTLRLFCNA